MPESLTVKQAMRYNRQIVLPQIDLDGQEAIRAASILIVGVGGLGTAASLSLCGAGVGKLTLVDDDCVELHNLPRQTLFTESQVGMKKVNAARDNLLARNNECQVSVITSRLNKQALSELVEQHTLVLDCTDNVPSRQALNQACYAANTPLIIGAAIRFEGQLMVVEPKLNTACYGCVSQLFKPETLSCTEAGILAPVVTMVGTYQSLLALQYLTQPERLPVNTLMMFDAGAHQWQHFALTPSQTCTVCQQ